MKEKKSLLQQKILFEFFFIVFFLLLPVASQFFLWNNFFLPNNKKAFQGNAQTRASVVSQKDSLLEPFLDPEKHFFLFRHCELPFYAPTTVGRAFGTRRALLS
jgi:hypothetical protein